MHYRAALRGSLIDAWLAEGLWPTTPLPITDVEAVQRLADHLMACLDGDQELDTRRRAAALEVLLLEVWHQQRHQPVMPSWVLAVQRRLERDWRREPDYQALARRHQMPVHALRRGFRNAVGQSIHDWFLRLRHARIRELLLQSDEPIAVIAERSGFQDVGFFSRQFKRFAGVSPSAFRQTAYA